jgi:dTDP-4-dehydrorhamnose 3,5-epimerase
MNVIRLEIPDVLMLEPKRFKDDRGFFAEVYNERAFHEAGITNHWVQDNHARSNDRHVLRGLHFQAPPRAQAKLVRVAQGSIFDVVVDIREGSPSFGQKATAVLSATAWNQLYVPAGFAHGYLTLEPFTEVLYKVSDYYAPECEGGIRWSDPDLAIDWPLEGYEPHLSTKDHLLPRLRDFRTPFRYG